MDLNFTQSNINFTLIIKKKKYNNTKFTLHNLEIYT